MSPNVFRHMRHQKLHFNERDERGRIAAAKVLGFGLNWSRLVRLAHEEWSYHIENTPYVRPLNTSAFKGHASSVGIADASAASTTIILSDLDANQKNLLPKSVDKRCCSCATYLLSSHIAYICCLMLHLHTPHIRMPPMPHTF